MFVECQCVMCKQADIATSIQSLEEFVEHSLGMSGLTTGLAKKQKIDSLHSLCFLCHDDSDLVRFPGNVKEARRPQLCPLKSYFREVVVCLVGSL